MPQCVVIADDLTGGNATGVLLKKMNYQVYTVMNTESMDLQALEDCDCVIYPTDSRGVAPEVAYERVYNICSLLKDDAVKVYSNRIDSTLGAIWAVKPMPCWIVWERIISPLLHPASLLPAESLSAAICWSMVCLCIKQILPLTPKHLSKFRNRQCCFRSKANTKQHPFS